MNEPVSIWAPGGEDEDGTAATHPDRDTPSAPQTTAHRPDARSADPAPGRAAEASTPRRRPADEFEAIFGSPTEIRPLGQEAIAHRRRGMASAAGGGEVLDRRQRGTSDDVLVTLLAHPAMAAERAVTGSAFVASRRLRVDLDARRSERRDVVFDASLRTFLWLRRPARLRLYGSASMNVTVLTLTPRVARRRPSRWFVRSGNRAMERIVGQLAAEVEPLRWQPPLSA